LAAGWNADRGKELPGNPAFVYGSLFVRHLDQSAALAIHYDVDVRRANIGCPL
jgi:hypothetical protein